VAHLGDTLAAQDIGNFVCGVGKAFKPCRSCDISRPQMRSLLISDQLSIRDETEHRDRIAAIEAAENEVKLKYLITHHGVKGDSCLLRIRGLEITKALPHDYCTYMK
jgi:hypothetical protein